MKARGCKRHRVGREFPGREPPSDVPTSVLWALHPQVNLLMTEQARPHPSAQLPGGRHTCRANTVSGQRGRPISFHSGLCLKACAILVPQPGIRHLPLAVETCRLNHWTDTEVPGESHSLAAGRIGQPSPTGNSRAILWTSPQGDSCAHLV